MSQMRKRFVEENACEGSRSRAREGRVRLQPPYNRKKTEYVESQTSAEF